MELALHSAYEALIQRISSHGARNKVSPMPAPRNYRLATPYFDEACRQYQILLGRRLLPVYSSISFVTKPKNENESDPSVLRINFCAPHARHANRTCCTPYPRRNCSWLASLSQDASHLDKTSHVTPTWMTFSCSTKPKTSQSIRSFVPPSRSRPTT